MSTQVLNCVKGDENINLVFHTNFKSLYKKKLSLDKIQSILLPNFVYSKYLDNYFSLIKKKKKFTFLLDNFFKEQLRTKLCYYYTYLILVAEIEF